MNKIQEAFLRANYQELSNEDLTDLFNKTFKSNLSINSIKYYKHKLGIVGYRYGTGKRKKIGSERPKGNGFIHIKVAEPDVWMYKHRYIYEQAYGKIPKGYNVIFLDGDKTNFSLDNLALVENKIALRMKMQGLMTNSKELTETGILIAELQNKSSELLESKQNDIEKEETRKEKMRKRALNYYYNNKEKVVARKRMWRQANAEKNRQYQREWYRRKKLKNIVNNDTTS